MADNRIIRTGALDILSFVPPDSHYVIQRGDDTFRISFSTLMIALTASLPTFTPGPTAPPSTTPPPTTPGPTSPGATPPPTTPPPTTAPAVFSYTSAIFVAWLFGTGVNPGGSGSRLPNIYIPGFQLTDTGGATTVQISVLDDVVTTFANSVTVKVKKNGSDIRSQSGTGPFIFNLTTSEVTDGDAFNVTVDCNVANDNPKTRTTITKTGPGVFNDASLRTTLKNWSGGGPGFDSEFTLTGVPLGCVVPYAAVVDHTMGGYARDWLNPLSVNTLAYDTVLDGTDVDGTVRTNFSPTGSVISFYASRTTFGESEVEIDASVSAPANPAAPIYTFVTGSTGTGFSTGGGPKGAGTYTNVVATPISGHSFINWDTSGAGVNNTNAVTSPTLTNTTVFIDGPKTATAHFT